jgi:hypothetical protein
MSIKNENHTNPISNIITRDQINNKYTKISTYVSEFILTNDHYFVDFDYTASVSSLASAVVTHTNVFMPLISTFPVGSYIIMNNTGSDLHITSNNINDILPVTLPATIIVLPNGTYTQLINDSSSKWLFI